jgi:hypothetical protein
MHKRSRPMMVEDLPNVCLHQIFCYSVGVLAEAFHFMRVCKRWQLALRQSRLAPTGDTKGPLTDADVGTLATSLPLLQTLKLRYSYSAKSLITDSGMEALSTLKNLKCLRLTENNHYRLWISAAGCAHQPCVARIDCCR